MLLGKFLSGFFGFHFLMYDQTSVPSNIYFFHPMTSLFYFFLHRSFLTDLFLYCFVGYMIAKNNAIY